MAGRALEKPNACIFVAGDEGHGKSTYAAARAREYLKRGWHVVAHDPTETFVGRDVRYARDPAKLMAPGWRGCVRVLDGREILPLVDAASSPHRSRVPRHGAPVLIVIEEGAGLPEASNYRVDPRLREALVTRRHRWVGFLVVVQSPEMVHYTLLTRNTEVVAFRITDTVMAERLARGGWPRARLPELAGLPPFHYRRLVRGAGMGSPNRGP